MSAKTSKLCTASLASRNVEIRTGFETSVIEEQCIQGSDGTTVKADLTILATGTTPGKLFEDSSLTEVGDPGLAVDKTLRHRIHRNIFAAGDCAYHPHSPVPRVGVYAVRQAPILFENLKASMTGEPMKSFTPQKKFLLILNMGDGTGVLEWRGLSVAGGWAWRFKRRLDISFMERFQP